MTANRQSGVWKLAKQTLLDPVRRSAFRLAYPRSIPLMYFQCANWGDALSPLLTGMLSGRPVVQMLWHHQRRYLVIGSILGDANGLAEVWGSGFLLEDEQLVAPPKAIHAVRGPRSRAKLIRQGIDCPEIYGDPALLLPRFFNPQMNRKYAVGIIPHYCDKDSPWLDRYRQDPQVRIIDVEGGVFRFVEEVKSCELILSSSLHGLICADAYGVPNVWIQLSDKLLGGSFKFLDYFESVGRDTLVPVRPEQMTPLGKVAQHLKPCSVKINLHPLIAACPFMAADVRRQLLAAPDDPGLGSTYPATPN